jgi:glutamate carboxypeptidase
VILMNACEEVISSDFGELCREHLPQGARACLIFEADGGEGDGFALVAARKGRATFDIEVEGHGAHAGGQHRRGANAVVQLAEVVQQLHELTDYDAGLTVNIASVAGGTVLNRVPHAARASLEMRAFTPLVYDRAKQEILSWNRDGSIRSREGDLPCTIRVHIRDESNPWPRNVQTDLLCSIWQQVGEKLGLQVTTQERGGLSDGNVLWDAFPTLDGLGPRGDHCHCSERTADGSKEQEWVDVTSFVPKAVLNCCAIERLLAEPGGE